ncbi:putative heavy metal translocating p-type atpase [Diplodia seriata]|uniref:Putative heavy metal translocating P-type atpase n=1 Tax=Diplodia seriata TaxID=420778 RepID=A0A0G2F122_9PEZI|nr:putative heavy metal translocating p-type atpase [Diplodia seriata]
MPSKRQSAATSATTTTTTNNAAAPPSDVTATADDAAVRKRKQNRLSQQCLREKRSAGVANQSFFERLAADIRRLREVCETRQQQEGASAAAEDPVFQKLLGKESEAADAAPNKRRKCSSSAGSGSASGRAVGSVSSDADDQPDRVVEPMPVDEGEIFANLQGEPSGSFNPLSSGSFDQRLVPTTTSGGQPHSLHVFPPPPQHTTAAELCSDFTATTARGPNQDFHAAPNFSFTNLPQISLTNTAILDAWVSRSYANSIAQKIENVCVQYALKSRAACKLDHMGAAGLKPGPVFQQFDERAMVERLADIAVHMIFDDTGLGRFINTLEGARDFLRSVLTCRIMLGCAAPYDLADEPDVDADTTPPWATTSTRPLIVDLIAWPSLRDQMIFHSSFYDLDEMTEDVVNYTVVDLPGQNLALQMYSTPPNPFPSVCREYDGGVRPFRFSEQEFTHKVLQVPNRDLLDIVARRMEAAPCGGPASGGGGGGGGAGGGGVGLLVV